MSNITFTARQAYLATLLMRINQPVSVQVIAGLTPVGVARSISKADGIIRSIQGAQARQPKPHQLAALRAWWAVGIRPLTSAPANAAAADAALINAGRSKAATAALRQQAYVSWLAAACAQTTPASTNGLAPQFSAA